MLYANDNNRASERLAARDKRRARRRQRSTEQDVMPAIFACWLGIACCAALLWVSWLQYRAVYVNVAQEDDCREYYGAYQLSRVERNAPDHVTCVYQ